MGAERSPNEIRRRQPIRIVAVRLCRRSKHAAALRNFRRLHRRFYVCNGSMLSKNICKKNVKSKFETKESKRMALIQGCAFVFDLESMLLRDARKLFFDSIGQSRAIAGRQ
jgi:hypothetical protein